MSTSATNGKTAHLSTRQKITPFLWFDNQAEEAANFYVSIFPNSKITTIARYGDAGPGAQGSVMTVGFELDGHAFTALNAGPHFKFSEAVSFVIDCQSQDEVDYFWDKLTADGGQASQCGWLKDRFGLSWQVTPSILIELTTHSDAAKASRAMRAMMQMGKIDIARLQQAVAG